MYDSANLRKIKTLKELAPEGMAAWATLNDVSMKDGAIPKKYKELMALAAVVAAALRAGGAITHATHAIG